MHDVAKPATSTLQMKSVVKTVLKVLVGLLLLAALIAQLKAMGIAGATIIVIVLTVLLVVFGLLSFRRFAQKRTTAGAVFAFFALFFLLADVKVSQVRKMMSTPFAMPPTAVSSASVTEQDWAPVLPAVGSISAVEGAIVATELGGVVSKVEFQNGGVAKKRRSPH